MLSQEAQSIRDEALAEIDAADDAAALAAVVRRFLGKEGRVGALLASIPKAPPEERRGIGQAAIVDKRQLYDIVTAIVRQSPTLDINAVPADAFRLGNYLGDGACACVETSPYLHGATGTGQPHRLVVIPPHPHHSELLAIIPGKPAVTQIIGRTGFARQAEFCRESTIQAAGRAFLHDFLQGSINQQGWTRIDNALHVQSVPLQGFTVGIQHFAYGAQRDTVTTAGEIQVQTCHFERTEISRPQKQRRIGIQRRIYAQATQGTYHPVYPELQAETRGGDIVGMRQRLVQHHLAMEFMLVVVRCPDLSVRFVFQRAVVKQTGQVEGRRILQRGQVNRRLEQ